jgi:hypothetical protein
MRGAFKKYVSAARKADRGARVVAHKKAVRDSGEPSTVAIRAWRKPMAFR